MIVINIIIIKYTDNPTGIMNEKTNGSGYFSEVSLNPTIVVTEKSMIKKAIELHKKANELCFIANSVNFKVFHNPTLFNSK